MLEQEGVSAALLEIEITEDHLVPNNQEGNCQATLRSLSELGIKMSIDDFGTGYSSLSQLKNLPISTLKTDKSFVDNVPVNQLDAAIIKSILSLAKNLGLEVMAEGVETAEQLICVRDYGCDLVQGYYYSQPVCAEKIAALLEARNLIKHYRYRRSSFAKCQLLMLTQSEGKMGKPREYADCRIFTWFGYIWAA